MTQHSPISSTRGFRVHVYQKEDTTVVECHGKLTVENAPLLKSEAKGVIGAKKRIVLDLKEVPFMDSSGLGTIAGLYVSARTNRCEFALVNANQQIRELLGISKLLLLFESTGRHGGRMM
jgi:anti-sigma B factor antagonist